MSKNNHFTTKEVIIGAAIGSLIVSIGAVLMAPKPSKMSLMRKNISNMYGDISDRTHEITDCMVKKGKCLMNMNCSEPDWKDKAKCLLSDMTQFLTSSKKNATACDMLGGSSHCEMWVGVLAGGIVGAVAGLLVAPKAGEDLRDDFIETYEDLTQTTQDYADSFQKRGRKMAKTTKKQVNKWLDLASTVINEFVDHAEDVNDQVTDTVKDYADTGKEKIEKALEWAALGLRVWKGLTK